MLRFCELSRKWQYGVIDHSVGTPGYPGWLWSDTTRDHALDMIERGFEFERVSC